MWYAAYGSNLHPLRLTERISSAQLVATSILPDWSLHFHKRSKDGSGKCTIAAADITQSVFGAVYAIDPREKALLDRIEGVGAGYDVHWEELLVNGTRIRAFVYLASAAYVDGKLMPYRWYKGLVLAGARHHQFPAAYISALETVQASGDPDGERQKANEAILAELL